MSCSNCDCEECIRSRHMNDDEEDIPSSFGRLPPPPPFAPSDQDMSKALHAAFAIHPRLRMSMPMVVNLMARELNVPPHHWQTGQDLILAYVRSQAMQGTLNITKGKDGGVSLNSQAEQVKAKIEVKKTIAGPLHYVGESPLQNATSMPAINNHTCLGCGNTKCSKDERSCWKCGHPIA